MKIQDIIFLLLLFFLAFKRNHYWSITLGLACFFLAIPLFAKWIFFTAERLIAYGGGFILLGILQMTVIKNISIQVPRILKNKILLDLLFIGIIIFNIGNTVYQNKEKYCTSDYWERYEHLKYEYENSQYIITNPKGWIPDEMVFAYAGGALSKGVNPTYIASGSAPLGKYLISLSILTTGNENIIILISAVLSLYLMYLLGIQVFSNRFLALLAPTVFSFEPIFKNQLIYVPLLDIIQLPFLLASLYFFNRGMDKISKNRFLNFILANISLGGFIAVKFFLTGFIILAAWLIVILIRKDKVALKMLLLSLPFSLLVLIISYFKVFIEGYTLRQFFGIQKWIFLYQQSKLILPFAIWPLIFFNRWYVWYGDKPVITDAQWTIMWPLIQVLVFTTVILYLIKKIHHNKNIEILIVWSLLYTIFLSLANPTSRYLVIYFPVIYIVTVFGIVELANKYNLFKFKKII
jgi:hypothetical protein